MSRNPKLNPAPGDRLLIKGDVALVLPSDGPTLVKFEWRGQEWQGGLARWQNGVAAAQLLPPRDPATDPRPGDKAFTAAGVFICTHLVEGAVCYYDTASPTTPCMCGPDIWARMVRGEQVAA
jgi:hypothetical protein